MAQSKRVKSTVTKSKKSAAAKQAVKKKQLTANKSRNEILREQLDGDAASILKIRGLAEAPSQVQKPTQKIDVSQALTEVTAMIGGL